MDHGQRGAAEQALDELAAALDALDALDARGEQAEAGADP
jgi:hypothetical protein